MLGLGLCTCGVLQFGALVLDFLISEFEDFDQNPILAKWATLIVMVASNF